MSTAAARGDPGRRTAVEDVGAAFGVLGPVTAWDAAGNAIDLKGPRHRSVLARLLVARGRVVPVSRLVDDLWTDDRPADAVGAVRTFVAALRRALEPGRPPRTPARLLVTDGPGYALRTAKDTVDAWRFEDSVGAAVTLPPREATVRLDEALGWWRGPAYAQFAEQAWARTESRRLTELRLHAVELRAETLLALGLADRAAADLRAHAAEHPWRENAWRLLALALYRTGRQADALDVLRRARALLAGELGIDPGPGLRSLEADILHQADHLGEARDHSAGRVWEQVAAAYDRTVAPGARARLESTAGLLRNLALTGGSGLPAAREHRVAAVAAAEELGDAELTARVIGTYDVPAIWTRLDDPEQAAQVVAAAERTLTALPAEGHQAAKSGLLATIALESRGTPLARGPQAARRAEELARRLDDPALLAFALNAAFMQCFDRTGLAPRRDEIGAELVALSARHGLSAFEILGHLVRLQARAALGDFTAADRHAAAADALAARHERPLVGVFTGWYAALRLDATGRAPVPDVEAAYRDAAALLDGAGMPGLAHGLPPLALLCLRVRHALPLGFDEDTDWGPYAPWAHPLLLLDQGRRSEAAEALHATPEPPRDLLQEALWCLTARAALTLGDRTALARARTALAPAANELAGAASGLLTLGPVSACLAAIAAALGRTDADN
ncbi:BTAD domain-containing putative transcriptional regulator [Streptomyces sp. NPDC057623]|uniref:AfsR/SARP family transcriptional regulator n=1 Tax=Streptomyces sp. NPDC057623 TaxID=3346187 RepID=UPI0036B85209